MNKTTPIYLIIFVTSILMGCKKVTTNKTEVADKVIVIDSVKVLKNELVLNQLEGKWYYQGKPFNGYSLKLFDNDTIQEQLGFYNGKREGIARTWSEKGMLRIESNYNNNRLSGNYKSWWENGVLAYEANYDNGLLDGIENTFYPSGLLAKRRRLNSGKEKGLQKAWLENGKLYVNYEAKNGRIFGMLRANSCYKLEDEKIVRDKKI